MARQDVDGRISSYVALGPLRGKVSISSAPGGGRSSERGALRAGFWHIRPCESGWEIRKQLGQPIFLPHTRTSEGRGSSSTGSPIPVERSPPPAALSVAQAVAVRHEFKAPPFHPLVCAYPLPVGKLRIWHPDAGVFSGHPAHFPVPPNAEVGHCSRNDDWTTMSLSHTATVRHMGYKPYRMLCEPHRFQELVSHLKRSEWG